MSVILLTSTQCPSYMCRLLTVWRDTLRPELNNSECQRSDSRICLICRRIRSRPGTRPSLHSNRPLTFSVGTRNPLLGHRCHNCQFGCTRSFNAEFLPFEHSPQIGRTQEKWNGLLWHLNDEAKRVFLMLESGNLLFLRVIASKVHAMRNFND
jgi:hypothetical protein